MSNEKLSELRRDYRGHPLLEIEASADPFEQFERWFSEAREAEVLEPNAMTLATVDEGGLPSARVVLLKGFDREGLVFYTNYESRKSRELEATGRAALCFWWAEVERQVRVEGPVKRVSPEVSAGYFASRPRGSQIGAWASRQSSELPDRESLAASVQEVEKRFADQEVPLPKHWGGFRLSPTYFEFWQGQSSRLHDRLEYRRDGELWRRRRLSP